MNVNKLACRFIKYLWANR